MTDLRTRLANVYLDREYDGDPALDSVHPDVRAACLGFADVAVAVVADWLRELAELELAVPVRTHTASALQASRACALIDAADSLTPTQETP